jgi:hypothetical protein
MTDTKLITARSILLGFLDLRRLSPDLRHWTEKRLSDNPPRLIRLRQLVAMFRAFGLPWNPRSFTQGKFIKPEDPRYTALLSKLEKEVPKEGRNSCGRHQLPFFFALLFDYRSSLEETLSFTSGVLEASGLYLHACHKAEELNTIIRENVAIVEDILVALISPGGLSFSVEQLARDYDYPDVDLLDLDIEWM